MIDQKTFDDVADGLVAAGTRVTYGHLREAFAERNRQSNGAAATSHSMRDIQDPFDDWKLRRRYRPHLAALDLDGRTEKALTRFLALARSAKSKAIEPADDGEAATCFQVEGMARRFEEVAAMFAAETGALKAEVARLASAMASIPPATDERPKGRKSGIVASASLHFWDRLMQEFALEIRKRGPLTARELDATIADDTRLFASRNFQRITPRILAGKLATRNKYNKYIKPLGDGRYDLIKRGRSPKPKATDDAGRRPRGKGVLSPLP